MNLFSLQFHQPPHFPKPLKLDLSQSFGENVRWVVVRRNPFRLDHSVDVEVESDSNRRSNVTRQFSVRTLLDNGDCSLVLVNLALKTWAADEIKSVFEREENGAAHFDKGEPPDWRHFKFDCTSVRHSDKPFPDLSTETYFGPYETREAEEGEVRTIWRWRPRHISDLEDFYLDLLPNDVLRLLLREETRVNHSSAYSWNESAHTFEGKWRELPSFR